MKLIDKDKVVAEIERMLHETVNNTDGSHYYGGRAGAFTSILSFINALEVKDVDLEKECDTWRHNHFHGRRDKEASGEYLERNSQLELAKHFFELGLKAQKGE